MIKMRSSDDPLLSLLHLWSDRRHPELPVRAGVGEASGRAALAAHGGHDPGLPGRQQLHPLHLAHLPAGQHRAAEDVPGARALAAPLPRDDREGERARSGVLKDYPQDRSLFWVRMRHLVRTPRKKRVHFREVEKSVGVHL